MAHDAHQRGLQGFVRFVLIARRDHEQIARQAIKVSVIKTRYANSSPSAMRRVSEATSRGGGRMHLR
jgi:hypothetical protein